MNRFSSDSLARNPAIATGAPAATRTTVIAIAWLAMLLLSKLPLVIARDVLGVDIPWMTPIWLATAVLFFGATYAWPALKPLRGYFAVMGAIVLASFVVFPFVLQSAPWQSFFAQRAYMTNLFAQRVLLVILTLGVLIVVFLMGLSRREAFLTVGDLNAPVSGLRLPGGRRVSWTVFGTAVSLLLAGSFFAFLLGQIPEGASALGRALPWAPVIVVGAALNAFAEEGMYRAGPLATLLGAVGPRHALWLTAVFFGLGHYYGGFPSGPAGMVQSGLLALLMGKAMLDTRGMGWAWIIHVVIDTVIYVVLALTS